MNDNPLRNLFGEAPDSNRIDVNSVLKRTRRRRLPKQIAGGSVLTLAVAGIAVAGVQGFSQRTSSSTTAGSFAVDATASAPEVAPAQGAASGQDLKRAPAEKLNLCGGALADVVPDASGLVLTAHFAGGEANAASVTGSVTMTNTGTRTWTGTTGTTPAITLSQNGITLWHTNGPSDLAGVEINLAPGESHDYAAEFVPVRCSVEDDLGESFRRDLPSVAPGKYQVSAAIDMAIDDNAELITGPPVTVTLK